MKGWMIAADGSAVNLDHVERVTAEVSSASASESGYRWYVLARLASDRVVRLVEGLKSSEAARTWIAKRFDETFEEHELTALDLVDHA